MRIIHIVSDGSIERFNHQKTELKALTPINEAGESIELYGAKVRKICKSLSNANQFEPMLVLTIIKALCSVSVECFRSMWMPKRMELDSLLLQIAFMDPTPACAFLETRGYDYNMVITLAENTYKSLLDNSEWTPSLKVTDAQKAPSAFVTKASIIVLVQTELKKIMKKGKTPTEESDPNKCGNCGKKGHATKDCRDKSKSTDSGSVTKGHNSSTTNWREQGPKSGEPKTVTKNDKTYNWCTKCRKGEGFWTQTHNNENHRSGPPPTKDTSTKPATTPAKATTAANLAAVGDGLGIYHQF